LKRLDGVLREKELKETVVDRKGRSVEREVIDGRENLGYKEVKPRREESKALWETLWPRPLANNVSHSRSASPPSDLFAPTYGI